MQNVHKINQILSILVLITLSIQPKDINNTLIALWAASTIFAFVVYKREELHFSNTDWKIFIPFFFYFTVVFIGIFYSQSPTLKAGATFIENKITFVVFPLLLLISRPVNLHQAMRFFVLVTCVLCLFCLGGAILTNIEYNEFHKLDSLFINPWFYTYYLYSGTVGLQPTYFSIYIFFALIYLLGWKDIRKPSWMRWALILFLAVNLMLLMARIVVAFFLVYYIVYVTFALAVPHWKKFVALGAALLLILAVSTNEVVQKRIGDIFEDKTSLFSGFRLKFEMWDALYAEVIAKKPLTGIGSVNGDAYLSEVYLKYGIEQAYREKYNCHNQYIEMMVRNGIFGLIAVLLLYGYNFYLALRQRNHLAIVMVLFFIILSLTESVFSRQKGIMFFAFVIPFLLLNNAEHHWPRSIGKPSGN